MFLKVVRLVSRIILHIIARIEIHHFDRIPASGGALVVTNHLGRLDAILGMVLADRDDVIMMIAEKYQSHAFWRWMVRRLDAIWLDRYHTDFRALREVYKRLKAGGIAAVAPEGTRSRTESMLPGKPGAAYLAARAGVPVIPVALTGTEDRIVRQRLRRFRRLHITITVGEPVELPPLPRRNRDQFLQEVTDEIMCRIAAMLPPKYRGVYADHPCLQTLQAQTEQAPTD